MRPTSFNRARALASRAIQAIAPEKVRIRNMVPMAPSHGDRSKRPTIQSPPRTF